jgi:hypothetical protein
VIIAFTVIFVIISLINLNDPSGFPSPIDLGAYFALEEEIGISHFNDKVNSAFSIKYAMGSIELANVPYNFMVLFCFLALILFISILLSIRLTLKILKTIKDKSFLLMENAIRLRWIALLSIAILFTDKLIAVITSGYLSNHIEYPGVHFSTLNVYTFLNIETVFSSLFLLVIAEVFRIGAKLKEEQDLTI